MRGQERKGQGGSTAAQHEDLGGGGFRAAGAFHLRTGATGKSKKSKKVLEPSSIVTQPIRGRLSAEAAAAVSQN